MVFFRILCRVLIGFLLITCCLSVVYRVLNPVSTLILKRWAFGEEVHHRYVPMNHMPLYLVEAVIVAEDARFCTHHGIDFRELKKAVIEAAEEMESPRGASTITMQVTRNLFLWQGRSYIRKLIEMPLSILVDILIGKYRIMEIYLNIAEWGNGIFGAEAASQHYFHKSVRRLSREEAAALVSILPSPVHRNPINPGIYTKSYAKKITRRLRTDSAVMRCVR